MSEYNGIHVQHPDDELWELKRWKAEAMQALNAIYKKSEEIGGKLGELSTDRVLRRLDDLEKENKKLRDKTKWRLLIEGWPPRGMEVLCLWDENYQEMFPDLVTKQILIAQNGCKINGVVAWRYI